MRLYSDAELARVLRHGVRRTGRSAFVMPSAMFREMTDADLGRTLAFLRSLPERDGPADRFDVGPMGRLGLVMGAFPPVAEGIDHAAPPPPAPPPGDTLALGRYLARTLCTECHGADLRGEPDGGSPSLVAAAAYTPAEFDRLLRTACRRAAGRSS